MPSVTDERMICNGCGGVAHNTYRGLHNDYYCRDCFYEHYRYCDECGEVIYLDDSYYHENSGNTYCSYCWEENGLDNEGSSRRNCIEFPPKSFNLSNVKFKHLRYRRCFGIELEINDDNLPYIEIEGQTVFGSKYDGSLDCGSEMYSPILQGDKGYNEIKKLCNIVENCHVGTCAGYHLHIDARNLTWRSIKKIWMVYNIFEGVLYSILPKSRRNNRYCRKSEISLDKIEAINSRGSLVDTWYSQGNDDINNHYNDTRYFGLNLHAYFFQSTIEIRYHSSTTNFDKVINWIKINQAIFEYALTHTIEDIIKLLDFENCKTNYTRIRKLFKEVIGSDSLWRYYKKRFEKFSSNQKQYGWYWKVEDETMAQRVERVVEEVVAELPQTNEEQTQNSIVDIL
jgi:hypothetical protein